jgi:hypothetical protein
VCPLPRVGQTSVLYTVSKDLIDQEATMSPPGTLSSSPGTCSKAMGAVIGRFLFLLCGFKDGIIKGPEEELNHPRGDPAACGILCRALCRAREFFPAEEHKTRDCNDHEMCRCEQFTPQFLFGTTAQLSCKTRVVGVSA